MIEFPAVFNDSGEGKGTFPVATEEELIEFANKVRTAGGADVIDALLPSTQTEPAMCLIANALNFSSHISPLEGANSLDHRYGPEYRYVWAMHLPFDMADSIALAISEAAGVALVRVFFDGDLCTALAPLPPHIGNAADAFDEGLAFQDFVINNEEN
jgi:hypothetical protein